MTSPFAKETFWQVASLALSYHAQMEVNHLSDESHWRISLSLSRVRKCTFLLRAVPLNWVSWTSRDYGEPLSSLNAYLVFA